ncbi:uncharacterized protein LOC114423061 [Glycine soja]|uniref:DUF1685 family protein n=1 Tax=Glycine soja TaxID=3848 RepID=A0A445JDD4_GLYSO|nr:uncharacterized protein LOC114423061 [Glycine soja]KAG5025213.1 hypothetical protein JHK86_021127 [Glycine max]KHN48012.1 hypothetical protein glysoja_015482 [Glycine soja]RZB96456.1 hypothetical protein D0Y65_020293 [Glycine soja]
MDAEAVLNLFDSCWFEVNILRTNSSPHTSITSYTENLDHVLKEEKEPKLPLIRTSHTRSMSDQLSMTTTSFNQDSLSPDSVLLLHPKLQTILSGKEATDSEPDENPRTQVRPHPEVLCPKKNKKISSSRTRKRRESKSLSDLEFEELKGFMDLGFVFSEEDKDSSLASIIPGLQRLRKKEEEEEENEDCDEISVPRPYLSEAWEVQEYDRRKKENSLVNWKMPAINNETDMKESLRWWAHTVASTVR